MAISGGTEDTHDFELADKTANATDNGGRTNAEDQRAVAELKERIAQSNILLNSSTADGKESSYSSASWEPVPFVSIDEGQWKYVLISAEEPLLLPPSGDNCSATVFFVTSKKGAAYHRNAAEPFVEKLQSSGYRNIHVAGGGRLYFNPHDKKIRIFGFSYGFGLADHATSKRVIEQDERFKDYEITWSNEGY